MRWFAMALALLVMGCAVSRSVTRTGTGLFAPKETVEDDEDAGVPIGLSLSVASIARDGTVTLDLRNYSADPFTFSGTPERPHLIIEQRDGNTQSRHSVMQFTRGKTHEVPAGERLRLTTNVSGATGRLRFGIRSKEFGYTVWTSWIAP